MLRPAGLATFARIHHLGLTVSNAETSADWYVNVLGFRWAGDYLSPDGSRRKLFLDHDRLDVRLGLCEHARSTGGFFDETRPGLDHLAFEVDSVGELGEWEERLRAAKVTFSAATPANTIEGARVVVFRDPDNIQLELIAVAEPHQRPTSPG